MRLRTDHAAALLIGALVLSASGCARNAGTPPDDEALRRAKEEARDKHEPAPSAAEVALNFFPTWRQGGEYNYFEGMDGIAADPQHPGDPLHVPVSQLSDVKGMKKPAFAVRDPVRTSSAILGRNTWMMWCGGNEGFWDWLANYAGLTDLLKLVDSRGRATRFQNAGLINEPDMVQASVPDRWGLWLDVPASGNRRRVRDEFLVAAFGSGGGSVAGESGTPDRYGDGDDQGIPPPEIYGLSTGIVGLRLFPNPDFIDGPKAKKAQAHWDAQRYYSDESYYTDPELIRPYRVGMACAFCHASYHPLKPPRDLNNPRWENISGNIGAQYLRIRAVFGNLVKEDNFIYHLLESQPPGTIDTSLVASDNINNPNAMNSVFNVPQRVLLSFMNPAESLAPASLTQPSLWGNPKESLPDESAYGAYVSIAPYKPEDDKVAAGLWTLFKGLEVLDEVKTSNDSPRRIPRILFDGSDSIGAWGALARVYLNIGTWWEQWQRLHTTLIGFTPQKPFKIADADEHSAYWHATQNLVGPLRDYFLTVTPPMPLLATPGGGDRVIPVRSSAAQGANQSAAPPLSPRERALHVDLGKLERGRKVFADNCLVCHSSIQPETLYVQRRKAGDSKGPGFDEAEASRREHARLTFMLEADLGKEPTPEQRTQIQKYVTDYFENSGGLAKRRFDALQEFTDPAHDEFWYHDPSRWISDPEYLAWAEKVVEESWFWRFNYLSMDYRIPVNLAGTNSARAMATNAIAGNMWSDFASRSYQGMPSVGPIDYFNPYLGPDGGMDQYTPRHRVRPGAPRGTPPGGGGPGFYRVPTLVSIWTTAPLLHNNSLGMYIEDAKAADRVTVDGRLEMFDDAIRKLLWPKRRLEQSSYNGATPQRLARDHGLIWRTPCETYLDIPARQVPAIIGRNRFVMAARAWILCWWPWLGHVRPLWLPSLVLLVVSFVALRWGRGARTRYVLGYLPLVLSVVVGLLLYLFNGELGNLRIGPIPEGTPVNLLANVNPDAKPRDLRQAVTTTIHVLSETASQHLDPEQTKRRMREEIAPALMKVSKCPDFVMDKGHDFEWFKSMSDEDKDALIELLKTF